MIGAPFLKLLPPDPKRALLFPVQIVASKLFEKIVGDLIVEVFPDRESHKVASQPTFDGHQGSNQTPPGRS